jgi:hypothetical protein
MYLIEGVLSGTPVYRKNTPAREGLESLVNEALSALKAAGASPTDYVQVSVSHPKDYTEPEIILIVLVSDGYIEILSPEDTGQLAGFSGTSGTSEQSAGLSELTDELGIRE